MLWQRLRQTVARVRFECQSDISYVTVGSILVTSGENRNFKRRRRGVDGRSMRLRLRLRLRVKLNDLATARPSWFGHSFCHGKIGVRHVSNLRSSLSPRTESTMLPADSATTTEAQKRTIGATMSTPALRPCPTCGTRIDSRLSQCPRCRHAMATTDSLAAAAASPADAPASGAGDRRVDEPGSSVAAAECDLVVDLPTVSGRHCRLTQTGEASCWRISNRERHVRERRTRQHADHCLAQGCHHVGSHGTHALA